MSDAQRLLRQAGTRLQEARALFEAGLYEGCVARSYYAAFSSARAMLASDSQFPKSHRGVLHEFGRRYVKTGIVQPGLHVTLARLESKRNLADYGSGTAITKADAVAAIGGAIEILEKATSYVHGG